MAREVEDTVKPLMEKVEGLEVASTNTGRHVQDLTEKKAEADELKEVKDTVKVLVEKVEGLEVASTKTGRFVEEVAEKKAEVDELKEVKETVKLLVEKVEGPKQVKDEPENAQRPTVTSMALTTILNFGLLYMYLYFFGINFGTPVECVAVALAED